MVVLPSPRSAPSTALTCPQHSVSAIETRRAFQRLDRALFITCQGQCRITTAIDCYQPRRTLDRAGIIIPHIVEPRAYEQQRRCSNHPPLKPVAHIGATKSRCPIHHLCARRTSYRCPSRLTSGAPPFRKSQDICALRGRSKGRIFAGVALILAVLCTYRVTSLQSLWRNATAWPACAMLARPKTSRVR